MKVFVGGVNGFIGSFLYSYLEKEFSIMAIDYSQGPIENNFTQLDLTDIHQVSRYTENCEYFDTLIFLVGLAHAKGKGKDLPEFKKVNYQTLINLLSSLEEKNKVPAKIIFASTISVYGEKLNQGNYGEDSEKKPFSPYAVTKLKAEQYLLDNFSTKSWILRFAPVYSSDFLLNIYRRTKIGGSFYQVGIGSRKLSLCNIKNIGAVVEAIIKDKVPANIYNISDSQEYTYNELLCWQKADWVFPIPIFSVKLLYYLGKFTNSIFLKENMVKLISDNIFPSDKIRSHIDLPATIYDMKLSND